jgi:hypothetical protein
LLGFTETSEKAVLPVHPVPTKTQFKILADLNTSLDKLNLIYDFLIFSFAYKSCGYDLLNGHFSYEAYSLFAGQQFFGCLKEPNNYYGLLNIINMYLKFVPFLSAPKIQ